MGELSVRWAVFCTFALTSNIIHPNYYSSYEITNSTCLGPSGAGRSPLRLHYSSCRTAVFPPWRSLYADEHGARWVFGGLVSFWQDNKAKTTTFDFSPEVAYLFNENWGLGVVGTYQYQKGNGESESLWALRPFARYYYMHSEPFNLYLDGWLRLL